jgi:hypothetical protein
MSPAEGEKWMLWVLMPNALMEKNRSAKAVFYG